MLEKVAKKKIYQGCHGLLSGHILLSLTHFYKWCWTVYYTDIYDMAEFINQHRYVSIVKILENMKQHLQQK